MISLSLVCVVVICDWANIDESDFTTLSAVTVCFLWLKVFYFGRMFIDTAGLIRMIIEVIKDMFWFLFIFIISVMAFINSFYILNKSNTDGTFLDGTFLTTVTYGYGNSLGDFSTDGFEFKYEALIYLVWLLCTLVTMLILLNLLIAMMGDTFDRVSETLENNTLKELCGLMAENEHLFWRNFIFKQAKYIIIISEEQAEEVEDNWEGKMKLLRKFMERNALHQTEIMQTSLNNFT
jgi:hypothetical protein